MKTDEILDEIDGLLDIKAEIERELGDVQAAIGKKCVKAHQAGVSDRRISEHIDGELSRTRIQQLRTRYGRNV